MFIKKYTLALLGVALVLWSITALPVIVGFAQSNATRAYVARIPIIAADTMAYYSNIEQARQGQWLFANQFTSEPQRPTMFHPVWLVTGWIGWLTQLSTPWAFQITRFMAIAAFIILLDRVAAHFAPNRRERWLVLILVATSTGLGWALSPGQATDPINPRTFTPDIWVAESNTYQSIGHSALFIGSQALMLLVFWIFWQWTSGQRKKLPLWLGPVLALLLLIHPYDLITVTAVLFAWSIIWLAKSSQAATEIKTLLRHGFIWCAWALPVLAYYWWIVLPEPAMRGWLKQNIDITSQLPLVLIGYGLLWPLAAAGWWSWRRKSSLATFLFIWIGVSFVLIYFPGLTFQRRLMSGLHLPIALLAGAGAVALARSVILARWRGVTIFGCLAILAMTNIQNTMADVLSVVRPNQADYPVYISRDEEAAIQWLKDQTTLDDVVFSEVWIGNTIAGQAGRTAVLGHGHQTINLLARAEDWTNFGTQTLTTQERTAMLQRLRVSWLFWRQPDALRSSYQPIEDPRWRHRYHNATVDIFQLQPDRAESDKLDSAR